MSIRFLNKSHSGNNTNTLNIFVQEDEPVSKDGIWLQENLPLNSIISDDNVYAGEMWDVNQINKLSKIPSGLQNPKACYKDGFIYLFTCNDSIKTNCFKYNLNTDTYSELTEKPYAETGYAIANAGGIIYFFGGYNVFTRAFSYDIVNDSYDTSIKALPFNFCNGSCETIGNNIFLFGGAFDPNKAYQYDITTNTYTQISSIPFKFTNGCSATVNGYIYLFGGTWASTTAYKYDPLSDIYEQITELPFEVNEKTTCISIGSTIYFFGSKASNQETYKYDTISDTYTKLDDKPDSVTNKACIYTGSEIYVFSTGGEKIQIMNLLTKDYPEKTIVIEQGEHPSIKTNLGNIGITNLKYYYDKVYYNEKVGNLRKDITVYNGDGTQWVKI